MPFVDGRASRGYSPRVSPPSPDHPPPSAAPTRLPALCLLAVVCAFGWTTWAARPATVSQGPLQVLAAPVTPDDTDGVEARAVAFIDGARTSLHAALYELGLPSVAMALRQARARGVDVRLFLESDNRDARSERPCLAILEGVVPIAFDGREPLMHDKFMVADGRRVWTGSVNLTWTGCHLHCNEAVVIDDPALGARFDAQFERLFRGATDAPALSAVDVGGCRLACGFAPGDDRLRPFLDAVTTARERIRIAAFSLTHRRLVEAIAERATAGLPVEIVLDARLAKGPAGRRAMARLQEAGCSVRLGGPRPSGALLRHFGLPSGQDVKIHHKLVVVDGRHVVTGSANLSTNGFERNDENVLAIEASRPVAAAFEALVDKAARLSVAASRTTEDEGDDTEK